MEPVHHRVFMQHSEVEANTVDSDEALLIDELHHFLGHISHEQAKFLIEKRLIEGVDLEAGSEASVCVMCMGEEYEKGSIQNL